VREEGGGGVHLSEKKIKNWGEMIKQKKSLEKDFSFRAFGQNLTRLYLKDGPIKKQSIKKCQISSFLGTGIPLEKGSLGGEGPLGSLANPIQIGPVKKNYSNPQLRTERTSWVCPGIPLRFAGKKNVSLGLPDSPTK